MSEHTQDEHNVLMMSAEEVHAAYAVLMDTQVQSELMTTPDHPEAWLLDFVFDSSLRTQLDARAAMLGIH